MELTAQVKQTICSLFTVSEEENVLRVITPLYYGESHDQIVVCARREGALWRLDDNGDAAFYANMAGADIDSGSVQRWLETLAQPTQWDAAGEAFYITKITERQIAPLALKITEAASQLYALATARAERSKSDFIVRIVSMLRDIERESGIHARYNVEVDLAGGLLADCIFDAPVPLLVIAANSPVRLLEAELIHTQYLLEKKPGFVLAVVENAISVGRKQFSRANYYTGKTVEFEGMQHDFHKQILAQLNSRTLQ